MDKSNNSKKYIIAIIVALILLLLGFYLYYFYPQVIPGMARISLERDLNVIIIGLDDIELDDQEEANDSEEDYIIDVDALVVSKLNTEEHQIDFTNIIIDEKTLPEDYTEMDLQNFMTEINHLIETDLNYYFTISYQGFINLVDNLGGIQIVLEEKLRVPDLDLDLEEGENTLTGQEALNYARWYDYRKDEMDRVSRQHQVMRAVMDQALRERTLLEIPQLFNTIVDTFRAVKTNLSYTVISDVVDYIRRNRDQLQLFYDVIENETNSQLNNENEDDIIEENNIEELEENQEIEGTIDD